MMRGTALPGRGTVARRRRAVMRERLARPVLRGYPRTCPQAYSAAMVVLFVMLVPVAAALSCAVLFWKRSSRRVGAPQRATYEVLHTASQAVSVLRDGLTRDTAVKAAPSLRHLLGTPTVAIADQAEFGLKRHAPLGRATHHALPGV